MKITKVVATKSMMIDHVLPGEVFSYKGHYYLVPNFDGASIPQDRFNGVSLITGETIDLAMDTIVDWVISGSIELRP